MRQFLKFAVALCVVLVIVLALRLFAFAVYTAPLSIGDDVRAGERVMVNKLSRQGTFKRGDILAFTVKGDAPLASLVGPPQELGKVLAVPGDTITVGRQRYIIPYKCCDRCGCSDCCLYLVDTGSGKRLVHRHQVVGKAFGL